MTHRPRGKRLSYQPEALARCGRFPRGQVAGPLGRPPRLRFGLVWIARAGGEEEPHFRGASSNRAS